MMNSGISKDVGEGADSPQLFLDLGAIANEIAPYLKGDFEKAQVYANVIVGTWKKFHDQPSAWKYVTEDPVYFESDLWLEIFGALGEEKKKRILLTGSPWLSDELEAPANVDNVIASGVKSTGDERLAMATFAIIYKTNDALNFWEHCNSTFPQTSRIIAAPTPILEGYGKQLAANPSFWRKPLQLASFAAFQDKGGDQSNSIATETERMDYYRKEMEKEADLLKSLYERVENSTDNLKKRRKQYEDLAKKKKAEQSMEIGCSLPGDASEG